MLSCNKFIELLQSAEAPGETNCYSSRTSNDLGQAAARQVGPGSYFCQFHSIVYSFNCFLLICICHSVNLLVTCCGMTKCLSLIINDYSTTLGYLFNYCLRSRSDIESRAYFYSARLCNSYYQLLQLCAIYRSLTSMLLLLLFTPLWLLIHTVADPEKKMWFLCPIEFRLYTLVPL